jgi:hypothetical protein
MHVVTEIYYNTLYRAPDPLGVCLAHFPCRVTRVGKDSNLKLTYLINTSWTLPSCQICRPERSALQLKKLVLFIAVVAAQMERTCAPTKIANKSFENV